MNRPNLRPAIYGSVYRIARLCAAALAGSGIACSHPSLAPTAAATERLPGAAGVAEYFRRASAFGFAGAVVVGARGQVVLDTAYGEADWKTGTPATTTTGYDLASLDKPLIAEGILLLERDGTLSTRDTLGKFFPDIPADKRSISIHHLLSHTGGIRDVYWDSKPALTLRQFAQYVLDSTSLEWRPGNGSSYASANYWILEAIIEQVTRTSAEQFLHDRVLVPSGMTHTGTAIPSWTATGVAHIRDWGDGTWSFRDLDYGNLLARPLAYQTMLSTANDLFRWYLTLRDTTVVTPSMKEEMWRPVRGNYGYGWNVLLTERHTRLIEHGGGGTGGGMRATFRYFPDEDEFFAVLSGIADPSINADYIGRDIESLLFGGPATMPPRPASFSDSARAAQLAGKYRLDNGAEIRLMLRPRGRLVVAGDDARAAAVMQFPELAGTDTLPQEPELLSAMDAAIGGVYGGLERVMGGPEAFRSYRGLIDGFRAQMAPLGAYHGSMVLYDRPWVRNAIPERQTFIGLRFSNGDVVLRILRWADRAPEMSLFRPLAKFSLVAAPMPGGTFAIYDFTLGRAITIRPDNTSPGRLLIESGGASLPARLVK